MEQFAPYAETLGQLLTSRRSDVGRNAKVVSALNGEACRESRRLIDIEERRRDGIFFTDSVLRDFALKGALGSIGKSSVVYDPTCGAGDLLLAATNAIPIEPTLAGTLRSWSNIFVGHDLHTEFARACRRRLVLAAWQRHSFYGQLQTRVRKDWFHRIRKGCGLAKVVTYENATHILMNPPFVSEIAPRNCGWASGAVNSAALFLDKAVSSSQGGTRIVAILPDVIRCGTRYKKLRAKIERSAKLNRIASYGLFDNHADVDVFVLDISTKCDKKDGNLRWQWDQPEKQTRTVSDHFSVSVGPVVDFRDEELGHWYPYLTADSISPWEEVFDVSRRRRFSKRLTQGPFVVVRRTSRPGDACRAVGSVVRGNKEFAVDNHLIICKPIDGTLRSCRRLIEQLENPQTSSFLDKSIRCRHLTVQAVKSIPWCGDE